MSKIEVVVATINKNDLSLSSKMKIETDLLIANQCQEYKYEEANLNGCKVRMISTATRGVGVNRNFGLLLAQGEILLLADDDIEYHKGYGEKIEKAFKELPKADVIIFRMQFIKNGKVYEIDQHKTRKLHIWNGLSFGTYQIAIKKKVLLRENINFTQLFGGGAKYSSGEDSLFLIDCFKKKLNIYSHDSLLGDNIRDSSTWFKGFTNKFFYDRGAFAEAAFPHISYLIIFYYLFAYRRVKNITAWKKLRLMLVGKRGYHNLTAYSDIH